MKKFLIPFVGISVLVGCDLQPKIVSLPDTVGEFIAMRYPALLADPEAQPEIYNSAVTDYGVYASPDLYGTSSNDDYVLYASVDDYIVPPAESQKLYGDTTVPDEKSVEEKSDSEAESKDKIIVPMYGGGIVTDVSSKVAVKEISVVAGDTLYSLAQRYSMTVDEIVELNNLQVPYSLYVGQKLKVFADEKIDSITSIYGSADKKIPTPTGVATTTKVELQEITVANGDTLYSISRKYSVPVNDLAVLNNLEVPFNLTVGQKLKVPNLQAKNVKVVGQEPVKAEKVADTAKTEKVAVKTEKPKISSDPTKKMPAIAPRSATKFSWPVKGTVLSGYGAKTGGLFNDGINISAPKGTPVKAAENGAVAYAGNEIKGMGNLIIVQHADGWMTVYAHLDTMTARRGTKVSVGQKIGTVGNTGKVDSPQLHFEIRKGRKAYNPASYLK